MYIKERELLCFREQNSELVDFLGTCGPLVEKPWCRPCVLEVWRCMQICI